MIRPRPHIAGLAAYALADLDPDLISLSQNESAWPPSPDAIAAGQAALADTALYPDPNWQDLRNAVADVHGLPADSVLCGNGSMELIWALIHAYAGPGDRVLSTAHAYALFRTAAAASGASYDAVEEPDLTVSIDALLGGVTPATRIVAVANPGNPTGTRIARSDLIALRDGLPEDVLLLIDEAYGEFCDTDTDHIIAPNYGNNTVVLRTFSKAYALAGQRIGWGVFPPAIAAEVRKIMNPNNVSLVGQKMAAAAMRDQAHMQDLVARTITERERFAQGLRDLGLVPVPSHTNFLLIPFADDASAARADRALRAKGVLMRGMAGYRLPNCLRATIGSREAMDLALAALAEWMETEDAQ